MAVTIPVAHDFTCPWCWVGFKQAERLAHEFGVKFDWLAYELYPRELEWPEPSPRLERPNRPSTLSRFEFLCRIEGMSIPPVVKPYRMRTFAAHQAVEFAKTVGRQEAMITALYEAYWLRGEAINELDVLRTIAASVGIDPEAMATAIREERFAANIVGFDEPSYATGVYNVPTFFIGEERLAERPTEDLRRALRRFLGQEEPLVHDLAFPPAWTDRPYTYLNMVSTIDGKILGGSAEDGTVDLGSEKDRALMQAIEATADCTLVGAETLRKAGNWNPGSRVRAVLTRGGDVPFGTKFFSEGASWVISPLPVAVPAGVENLVCDFAALGEALRSRGIERLLVMGGGEVNALFFHQDWVDEIFLTVAPKVKLGRAIPTLGEGEPFGLTEMPEYHLLSMKAIGDELFLRYRRAR